MITRHLFLQSTILISNYNFLYYSIIHILDELLWLLYIAILKVFMFALCRDALITFSVFH